MTTSEEIALDPKNESHWTKIRHEFRIRSDTVYLNHGSFGIALNCVRYRRDLLQKQLETQPMDFLLRSYEPLLMKAASGWPNSWAPKPTTWRLLTTQRTR